jgi:cell division septum initiation protein DivIVA
MNKPNNISAGILLSKYHNALKTLKEVLDRNKLLKKRIDELEKQVNATHMASTSPNIDYWGRPKASKKLIDDMAYEQQTQQRYQRLAKEVKAGKLDINMLSDQEQIIIQKMLDE